MSQRTCFAITVLLASCVVTAGRAQSPASDAKPAIAAAIATAKRDGRHVLLNFGAEWCVECRILDKTFADPAVAKFLKANFIVVPVHIGQMVGLNYAEQNLDVVQEYGVFTTRKNAGIPSIVILDPQGNVIARTDSGEWRHEGALTPDKVIQDLKRWAPKRQPMTSTRPILWLSGESKLAPLPKEV